ncbi:hypothetical protein [Umezawaea sp. NPDC059074]|uniref:hypothetical protein n=1 Tax=Umezawaea sp. NPDC059074 TaxID=3346716 RepID=UPI0036AF6198
MSDLPRYRRIFFRTMVRARAEASGEIAAHLARSLAEFGAVDVQEDGVYYKDQELLEFTLSLEPTGPVDDCVAKLRDTAPAGWHDSPVGPAWGRRLSDGGVPFLHPHLDWATLSPEQAATLPRYEPGDLVRILDCPGARESGVVGEEAEISSAGAPVDLDDVWGYTVRPRGWTTLVCFDEPELASTGHRVRREQPTRTPVISVRPDGVVTGGSG